MVKKLVTVKLKKNGGSSYSAFRCVCVINGSTLHTYLRFIKQADDDAKGPEVSNDILWVTLHILLFEDVNESLK